MHQRCALIQESGESSIKHMYHWNVISFYISSQNKKMVSYCVGCGIDIKNADVCTAIHLATLGPYGVKLQIKNCSVKE